MHHHHFYDAYEHEHERGPVAIFPILNNYIRLLIFDRARYYM
jgi:hypothetical protein